MGGLAVAWEDIWMVGGWLVMVSGWIGGVMVGGDAELQVSQVSRGGDDVYVCKEIDDGLCGE